MAINYHDFTTVGSTLDPICVSFLRLAPPKDSTTNAAMTELSCTPAPFFGGFSASPCTYQSPLGTLTDSEGIHARGCEVGHSPSPESAKYNMQGSSFEAASGAPSGTITFEVRAVEQKTEAYSNVAKVTITILPPTNRPPVVSDKQVTIAPHEVVLIGDPAILAQVPASQLPDHFDRLETFSGSDPDGDPFGFLVSDTIQVDPSFGKVDVYCITKQGNHGPYRDCAVVFQAKNKEGSFSFSVLGDDGKDLSLSPATATLTVQEAHGCSCNPAENTKPTIVFQMKGDKPLPATGTYAMRKDSENEVGCFHITIPAAFSNTCDPGSKDENGTYYCGVLTSVRIKAQSIVVEGTAEVELTPADGGKAKTGGKGKGKGVADPPPAAPTRPFKHTFQEGTVDMYFQVKKAEKVEKCQEKVVEVTNPSIKGVHGNVAQALRLWIRTDNPDLIKPGITPQDRLVRVIDVKKITKVTVMGVPTVTRIEARGYCGATATEGKGGKTAMFYDESVLEKPDRLVLTKESLEACLKRD